MSNFGEISNALIGKGRSMADDIKLSSEAKEAAIKKLDEAKDIIEKEGLDGTNFIISHLSGTQALEREASDKNSPGREQAKRAAIIVLKKKNGADE